MRWLDNVLFRIRALVTRRSMERELDEELAFHIERETEKLIRTGLPPGEARRRAVIAFGGVEQMREQVRGTWGIGLVRDLQGDLRFALRQLRRRPAFSFLAVATLALGIGGAVALLSVVNTLLVRPLPFQDEDRLVTFWADYNWRGVEFDLAKEVAGAYESLAAFSTDDWSMRVGDRTTVLLSAVTSAEIFDVLGASPLMGRTFEPGDDRPGAEPVIVLSHDLWRREFGADPGVLGTRIGLDGATVTVVGVMPEGFYFPNPETEAWRPLDLDPATAQYQNNGWLVLVGRTRPDATPEFVAQDLELITSALGERFNYPEAWDKTKGAYVVPLRDYLLGDVRTPLLFLLGAVGLLLLMACTNVTALLVTRTADRSGEMAVRAALGAGRLRLGRQLVTESVVLGALAGVVGAGLAVALFDVLTSMLPLDGGFDRTLSLELPALLFGIGLAVGVGTLVSVLPVRGLLRGDIGGELTGERTGAGVARGRNRLQGALVLSEALLAVMLVSGAALLVRSVSHLRSLDPGLDPQGVLTMELVASSSELGLEGGSAFITSLLDELSALPGVRTAAVTNRLPVGEDGWQGGVGIEGRPDLEGASRPGSYYRTASLDYFETMGMRVVRGRPFQAGDVSGALEVAIVNETFAERIWPGEDPIGKRFSSGFDTSDLITVVGVLRDHRVAGLVGEMPMVFYRPHAQRTDPVNGNRLVIKADVAPLSLVGPVRSIVRRLDNRVPLGGIRTMDQIMDTAMVEPLRMRFFLSLFGLLGLLLGTVGVYGVVSYSVSRRRTEYGVRLALGAQPGTLLRAVMGRSVLPVAVGAAGGILAALALSRFLESFLFGVAPTDPTSFAVAALILVAAGTVAALIPARRAAITNPVDALRAE